MFEDDEAPSTRGTYVLGKGLKGEFPLRWLRATPGRTPGVFKLHYPATRDTAAEVVVAFIWRSEEIKENATSSIPTRTDLEKYLAMVVREHEQHVAKNYLDYNTTEAIIGAHQKFVAQIKAQLARATDGAAEKEEVKAAVGDFEF